ncbi:DUF2778 domain-containing protein [Methylobacterium sp. J-078]|uniref:DUF2778 domain-containing protein n=1 Tax=Methylobacterium sp. J-078 TaxID=2836657 RepID=UPI001FBB87CE|nr:DUF2778 domain-containing protein [Methylobacterium sp. J-078]MCJ2047528.1 DUF2778 domain-containing protein [Methylobacterium sp. J-078]
MIDPAKSDDIQVTDVRVGPTAPPRRIWPGVAAGGTLALAVLLGGGLADWSRQPKPALQDAVATAPLISAVPEPEAAEIAAASAPETQAPAVPAERAQGETPAATPETALATAAPEPSAPDAVPAPSSTLAAVAPPLVPRLVPLPVPRPPEFRSGRAASRAPRSAARQALPVAAAPPEDTRSFVEKLFGIENPEPPRLAYAALETKPAEDVFRRALNLVPRGTGGVAVYDIRARVVTLPNGEKLEAHSGLGESMDDPAHVHVRMKGPTPVGTYDITEREQPFHGVRALRLHPVGGPEAVHGRVGLLAHTYMLGASGASNGCVSFKDYEKFLRAYLRGEVQRLVVVAGG